MTINHNGLSLYNCLCIHIPGGGPGGGEDDGDGSENIAYAVPSMILEHVLADHSSSQEGLGGGGGGALAGLPMLGLRWQRGESQALREALGLKAREYQGGEAEECKFHDFLTHSRSACLPDLPSYPSHAYTLQGCSSRVWTPEDHAPEC